MNRSSTSSSDRPLVRALAFCALAAGLAFGIHALLVGGLRRIRTGEYGFRNAIADGSLASDIVVVGSSRAMMHFDCDLIEAQIHHSCINLGLDGLHSNQQVPVLQLYLEHTRAPQLLVLEADVTSLEVQRRPLAPELYLAQASDDAMYQPMVQYDPRFRAVRYVPLFGFADAGLNAVWDAMGALVGVSPPVSMQRHRGFVAGERTWDGTFDAFKRENPHGVVHQLTPGGRAAIERLIALGQGVGARVLVVFSPEFDEVHPYLRNEAEVLAAIGRIAASHGARFVDDSHSPLGADPSLFYNSQHMNARGARLFSLEMATLFADELGGATDVRRP